MRLCLKRLRRFVAQSAALAKTDDQSGEPVDVIPCRKDLHATCIRLSLGVEELHEGGAEVRGEGPACVQHGEPPPAVLPVANPMPHHDRAANEHCNQEGGETTTDATRQRAPRHDVRPDRGPHAVDLDLTGPELAVAFVPVLTTGVVEERREGDTPVVVPSDGRGPAAGLAIVPVTQEWREQIEPTVAAQLGITYVATESWFCVDGRCPAFVGSTPITVDGTT